MGGVAEMFLLDEEREQVLLRRGFIREAIKNGIDIMCVEKAVCGVGVDGWWNGGRGDN